MITLFNDVSHKCSEQITKKYSTSFSSAINLFHHSIRQPIYDIYGFVRLGDEIVDSFQEFDRKALLVEFETASRKAICDRISINPIIHSFQQTVHRYNIPLHLFDSFLHSMQKDLVKKEYHDLAEISTYIYGSAEVVGLMCLCVFCDGNEIQYKQLEHSARKLGSALQKINFLRDIEADLNGLSRSYFPGVDVRCMCLKDKKAIEEDIENELKEALPGIRQLPIKARLGVYTAYCYYYALFRKIKKVPPQKILEQRIRIPDYKKMFILMQAGMHNRLNRI